MSIKLLKKYANLPNISSELSEDELNKVGSRIAVGFDEDLNSMQDWLLDAKKIEDMVLLKSQPKTTPFPESANVKLPLITKAIYEYSSSTYPEIIRDGKLVKFRKIGLDYDGEKQRIGECVSEFMDYQLLYQNNDWELELDRLLNMLPLIGFMCKKVYYDPLRKKIKSVLCDYKDLIVNENIKNLRDASRISHVLHYKLNQLVEFANAGIFNKEPIDELVLQHADDEVEYLVDCIEQHTFLDLDEDNYLEPYIVTTLKETGKVLRIVARYTDDFDKDYDDEFKNKDKVIYIEPESYFVDYHYLVSPKGKFHSVGIGMLLLYITETCNSLLNQLIDAGRLANLQIGFIDSNFSIFPSGDNTFGAGEFNRVKTSAKMKLSEGVMQFPFKEPSTTLSALLGMMIEMSKDLSSSGQMMTGNQSSENSKTGATLALLQEGKKVINSIQTRYYRSFTNELRTIFKFNSRYLDNKIYVETLDRGISVSKSDFDDSKITIIPVADPNLSSEAKRLSQAQFLLSISGDPTFEHKKVMERILQSANIENYQELFVDPKKEQAPNPEVIKTQADIENSAQELNIKGRELELKEKDQIIKAYEMECKILEMKSRAILNIAQAEAAEAGTQLADYQTQLDAIQTKIKAVIDTAYLEHEKEMAAKSQNEEAAAQSNQQEPIDNQPGETSNDQTAVRDVASPPDQPSIS